MQRDLPCRPDVGVGGSVALEQKQVRRKTLTGTISHLLIDTTRNLDLPPLPADMEPVQEYNMPPHLVRKTCTENMRKPNGGIGDCGLTGPIRGIDRGTVI